MAADERLSSIATEQPFDELKRLNEGLRTAVDNIVELNRVAKGLEVNFKGAGSLKDVVVAQGKLNDANDKIAASAEKARLQEIRLQQAREKAFDDYEKKLLKQQALVEAAKVRQQRASAADEKIRAAEAKQIAELSNDYGLLSKAYAEATLRAKNYVLQLGANHQSSVTAVADAKRLGDQLKALDYAVGQHQRNVGNYAEAIKTGVGASTKQFNGLGFAIKNIAGELPNIGISFRTFAQSISNNIGPLADAIGQVKKENAELLAQGKPTVSVGRQIASSIFSWQTAILALVAAFVAFAPKIADFVTGTTAADNAAKEFAESLKKVDEEINKTAGAEIAKLRELSAIASDTTQSIENRTRASKKMQDLYPQILGNISQETFLEGKAGQAINETTLAILAKARAQAASKKLELLGERELKLLEQQAEAAKRYGEYKEKAAAAAENAEDSDSQLFESVGLREGIALRAKEYRDVTAQLRELGKEQQKYTKYVLETNKASHGMFADSITDDPKVPKVKKPKDHTKEIAREAEKERKIYWETMQFKAEKEADTQKAIADDESKSLDERIKAYDTYVFAEILAASYKGQKEKQTQEEVDKAVNEIMIRSVAFKKKLYKEDSDALTTYLNKNAALAKKLADESFDDYLKKLDERQKIEYAERELNIKATGFLQEVTSSISDKRLQEFDAEIEAINRKRDAEIAGVEASSLSEQQKLAKITAIKAQAAAKEEEIEKQRKDRAIKNAIFQKTLTAAQIIMETSLAAMKAYNDSTVPSAVRAVNARNIIVEGGLRAALVLATPIPEYADGTEGEFVTGRALTDERGAELYIEKSGKAYMGTDKGPTVRDFKVPTQVISNEELMNLSRMYTMGLPMMIPQGGMSTERLEQGIADLKTTIKNKKEVTINWTEGSWKAMIKEGQSRQYRLNRNIHY